MRRRRLPLDVRLPVQELRNCYLLNWTFLKKDRLPEANVISFARVYAIKKCLNEIFAAPEGVGRVGWAGGDGEGGLGHLLSKYWIVY